MSSPSRRSEFRASRRELTWFARGEPFLWLNAGGVTLSLLAVFGLVLLLGSLWGASAGTMVMFIILIWMEFDPIARTADQLGVFQKGIAEARRIFALLGVVYRV